MLPSGQPISRSDGGTRAQTSPLSPDWATPACLARAPPASVGSGEAAGDTREREPVRGIIWDRRQTFQAERQVLRTVRTLKEERICGRNWL